MDPKFQAMRVEGHFAPHNFQSFHNRERPYVALYKIVRRKEAVVRASLIGPMATDIPSAEESPR